MTAEIQTVSSAAFDAKLDQAIMMALEGTPIMLPDGTPFQLANGDFVMCAPDAAILTVAEKRAKAKRGTTTQDGHDALKEAQEQHEAAMAAREAGNDDAPPQTNGDENIR